jgi:aconitase A
MNEQQALQVIEQAINAAIAKGAFANIHETNAIYQALFTLNEKLKTNNNV